MAQPSEPFASKAEFRGRTIIITGAAGTFGRALSFAFARAGANVVVNDLGTAAHHREKAKNNPNFTSPAEDLVVSLLAFGLSAVASTHDVVTESAAIVELALKKFGRVDALINAVGIHPYLPFEQQDTSVFRRTLFTNVLGPSQVIRACWPHFKRQKYGRVINCTTDGLYGISNSAAYIASQGALFSLTRSLAFEASTIPLSSVTSTLDPAAADTSSGVDIKINCVAPMAYPPMNHQNLDALPDLQKEWYKRSFTANSNVPAVLALASEKCSVTGETFELGAWGVGRMYLGTVAGGAPAKTMEEALCRIQETLGDKRAIEEPKSMEGFLEFKASYMSM